MAQTRSTVFDLSLFIMANHFKVVIISCLSGISSMISGLRLMIVMFELLNRVTKRDSDDVELALLRSNMYLKAVHA
jgi:hypothetical protein